MLSKLTVAALVCAGLSAAAPDLSRLKVRITWGHEKAERSEYKVRIGSAGSVTLADLRPTDLESGEIESKDVWSTHAGAGDIDGLTVTAVWHRSGEVRRDRLQRIWADLISASDADTARRLLSDPSFEQDPPRITVKLDGEGSRGFSVAVSQLISEKAIWIPSLGFYVTAGAESIPFEKHKEEMSRWKGQRVLESLQREPEATYDQYARLWENM